jgi:large subunit ribosomal protein L25
MQKSNRFDLSVEIRQAGRAGSRALRTQKKVPAIVYGAVKAPITLAIAENTVIKYKARAFENALFNLQSTEKSLNNIVVLMKDVAVHPLTRRPIHVDLFALDLTKTVRVFIEVKIEGKALGIAEGGLLNVVTREIEVECLPTAIPEAFVVDVSNLNINESIHVSDLKVQQGVKILSSGDLTIAVCNLFVEETAAPVDAAAATPAAGAAAPAAAAGAKAPAAAAGAKAPAAAAGAKAPAGKK